MKTCNAADGGVLGTKWKKWCTVIRKSRWCNLVWCTRVVACLVIQLVTLCKVGERSDFATVPRSQMKRQACQKATLSKSCLAAVIVACFE